MREELQYDVKIVPGIADHTGYLGIPDTFCLFQDMAATHAQMLGLGYYHLLEKDLYWLTVKTKIIFHKRPKMTDTVTLHTWPEAPGRLRCYRNYEILLNGEQIIAGRTEWAMIKISDGSLFKVSGIYPEDLVLTKGPVFEEPYVRIPEQFDGFEEYYEYKVRSTDIDVGAHMNNVAYIRAIAGSFSCDDWDAMQKNCIDLLYRNPCHEGDILLFQKHSTETGTDIRISRDGTTLLLARLQ